MNNIEITNNIKYKIFNAIYISIKKWNNNNDISFYYLKNFIVYILSKINITYNTICLSLYYFLKIKRKIEIVRNNKNNFHDLDKFLSCGKRMFVISLIISDKYLKDKCYKNVYWSKITRLKLHDINFYEKKALKLINYNLYISKDEFNYWRKTIID